MKEIAIIVAGGSGTRFGGQVPKQFLSLCGEPVLMHTVRAFAGPHRRLVVVLPEAHIAWWQDLCRDHKFDLPHRVVAGGASRWESVRNGLTAVASEVEDGDVIAVHDGVRPLASEALIARAFATAHAAGSAIPVVPVTDTVRQLCAPCRRHRRSTPWHSSRLIARPTNRTSPTTLRSWNTPHTP